MVIGLISNTIHIDVIYKKIIFKIILSKLYLIIVLYYIDLFVIGVGGFGKVFRGYYRGSEVAVKAATGVANESPELTKDRVLQVKKSPDKNPSG